jgi:malonyl-CoA/methylmalonyl-CoA synthetase
MMHQLVDPALWTTHLPDPSSASEVDVLRAESLPRAWAAQWASEPRAVVAVDAGGTSLTAEQLEEKSRRIAARLVRAGVNPGDRVVLSATASLDLVAVYVAAHRLSLTVVPINTAYGPAEVGHIVTDTAPVAAFVDDRRSGKEIAAAAADGIVVTGCDVDLPDGPDVDLDRSSRDTPALICYTSGTTGRPKGAVLSSGNLLASAEAMRIAWRWTPEDRLALALPLFHLHGLGAGINGTLVAGASAVLVGHFKPESVAEAIHARGATMFFGVPTMYHRFASSSHADALRRLRLCVAGSAPLSPELYDAILAASGQHVLERYGMTETVLNLSNPYDGERRPGTVGLPLPGVEVRLEKAGDTDEGEVQLRGPNVFSGYLNQPAASADSFTDDGWFRSGDLGALDADGYLRIVGRSKELIISGGYNVYPREIEDVLLRHPGVSDVAVVGRSSPEWGETVVAVVVGNGPQDGEAILEFAAGQLAAYKRPRDIRFVTHLPRNQLGKVLRCALADVVA